MGMEIHRQIEKPMHTSLLIISVSVEHAVGRDKIQNTSLDCSAQLYSFISGFPTGPACQSTSSSERRANSVLLLHEEALPKNIATSNCLPKGTQQSHKLLSIHDGDSLFQDCSEER